MGCFSTGERRAEAVNNLGISRAMAYAANLPHIFDICSAYPNVSPRIVLDDTFEANGNPVIGKIELMIYHNGRLLDKAYGIDFNSLINDLKYKLKKNFHSKAVTA